MKTVEFSTMNNSANFDADPETGSGEAERHPPEPLFLTAKAENYLKTVPVSARSILQRAFQRIGGRSNAIKAKCLSCANFDRDEIRHCSVETCPLHTYRPFQEKTT